MEVDFDWQMYVVAAKRLPDLCLREGLYRLALRKAEKSNGFDSLEVGLVLLDLADCLEAQSKDEPGEEALERAYNILRSHIKKHPELRLNSSGNNRSSLR
ncbi:MAG: hypothetical protein U0103_03605 [Candidatus Obscuribacterales bacterium]